MGTGAPSVAPAGSPERIPGATSPGDGPARGVAPLEVDVLGQLVVRVAGRQQPIRSARRRALLTFLAMAGNRPVSVERIVNVLTDGGHDEHAVATLRTYLSKLRADLGPAARALRTVDRGYVLALTPDDVDAHRFRRLVASARVGHPRDRLEVVGRALSLWRGEPLSDLAGTTWGRAEAESLTQVRIEAVRICAGAWLELGDPTAAALVLGEVLREHPHREDLVQMQMIALYRSGRQAEALGLYPRYRDRLARDLGVDPTPTLSALHSAILHHDPSLVPKAPAPGPALSAEVHSVIGREAELTALSAAYGQAVVTRTPHAVVLSGEAGMGKSFLAAEFARRVEQSGGRVLRSRSVPGGAAFGPLADWLTAYVDGLPDDLVAGHLGPEPAPLATLLPRLAHRLPRRRDRASRSEDPRLAAALAGWLRSAAERQPVLLVLDDLEHVAAGTGRLLTEVLAALPASPVLLVALLREEALGDDHPARTLVAGLRRHLHLDLLQVRPLTASAIHRLATLAHAEVDPIRLEAETGGNAFLVTRALAVATAADPVAAANARAPMLELVRERLAALSPDVVDALAAAAVAGSEPSLDVVAAALGADPDETAYLLAPAVAAGLLDDHHGVHYRFRHGLVREALLDRVGPTLAARARRRIAALVDPLPHHGAVVQSIARHAGDARSDRLAQGS